MTYETLSMCQWALISKIEWFDIKILEAGIENNVDDIKVLPSLRKKFIKALCDVKDEIDSLPFPDL